MITYKALGRHGNTGNALFQFATLISVAKDNGYTVKIPDNPTYFDVNYGSNNTSIVDGFNIKIPFLTKEESDSIAASYRESSFNFDKNVLTIADNVNLVGYFQSEKYFVHNRDYILDNLQFKEDIKLAAERLFSILDIEPETTTSIHVRRGDFVVKQQHHPLAPPQYFKEAVSLAKTKSYLVFSDDINWCKQAFGGNPCVHFSNVKDPFIDMCAMSLCVNNIIVNSTFSWWGAWLNRNSNKIVVAPKQWLGPAYANDPSWNTSDVIPNNWIKLGPY